MGTKTEVLIPGSQPAAGQSARSGGPLAGKTILRFAHAFETGGGTERYLEDLDRALLERNEMTVIRLHLTRGAAGSASEWTAIGRGRLVRIGLPIVPESAAHAAADEHSVWLRIKQQLRDRVLYSPPVWHSVGSRWAAGRRLRLRPGEAIGAGAAAAKAMRDHRIDLAMLHFFGGGDADEIIGQARAHGVPFAVLNHYSNDRFLHLAMRKHSLLADGVAGVSGLQLPRYLRDRFTNLSDGIDTEFFCRERARPVPELPVGPIVLLPARVVREKGHLDLVRAVAALRDAGIRCNVVFAGRAEPGEFLNELRAEIVRTRLTESAGFLGAISVEALRDWYAASTVVAFPTYHHEGLPRVIIEAQATGTPVVAYATGGVAGAIVPGSTGLLVRTGDLPGMIQGLREVLTSSALRQSVAALGRQAAEEHFSLGALARRHEEFYLRIAGRSAHRTGA